MASAARLPVVLLWHMHQPQYRDAISGQYVLPWTYLHAIKDYTDMAAHLEANPSARAVVNFSPVLIEQLSQRLQAVENQVAILSQRMEVPSNQGFSDPPSGGVSFDPATGTVEANSA